MSDEVVDPKPVVDDEGEVIRPGVRNDRKRGDDPDTKTQGVPEQATPEAIKRSVELQREAAKNGTAPDPSITGWDSARQVAVSPGANPENYLRSPGEARDDGDV